MAKSIADKIDVGMVGLPVKDEDLVKLESVLGNGLFEKPNLKISVYKNRRGQFKGVYLWAKADLGVCRVNPIFATKWDYSLVKIDDLSIQFEDEPSAF